MEMLCWVVITTLKNKQNLDVSSEDPPAHSMGTGKLGINQERRFLILQI
jgi:hypothetical protein